MFKLMKLVDGEWYLWGTYSNTDLDRAMKAAFYLGREASSVEDIKIIPVEESESNV